jgi:hypothetical protein
LRPVTVTSLPLQRQKEFNRLHRYHYRGKEIVSVIHCCHYRGIKKNIVPDSSFLLLPVLVHITIMVPTRLLLMVVTITINFPPILKKLRIYFPVDEFFGQNSRKYLKQLVSLAQIFLLYTFNRNQILSVTSFPL